MRGQRLADSGMVDLTPGDYRRQDETRTDPQTGEKNQVLAWYVRPPRGPVQRLAAELVTEHEDGTMSCSHPITNEEGDWSLVAGVWQASGQAEAETETETKEAPKEPRGRRNRA